MRVFCDIIHELERFLSRGIQSLVKFRYPERDHHCIASLPCTVGIPISRPWTHTCQTVLRSSQFVDDIKRLRKACGRISGNSRHGATAIHLAESKHRVAITLADKLQPPNAESASTHNLLRQNRQHKNGNPEIDRTTCRSVHGHLLSTPRPEDIEISATSERAKRTMMMASGSPGEGAHSPLERGVQAEGPYSFSNVLATTKRLRRPHSAPAARTGDDVERLRKVVREAMCVPRYYQVSMLCSTVTR